MKKLLLFVVIAMVVASHVRAATIGDGFRIWKSSYLGTGSISNVQLSSTPIIFHAVIGSPTINNGGDSYFAIHQSTGDVFRSNASTKAFVPLDGSLFGAFQIGTPFDVMVSSHAFITKQGGANVGYLWDYIAEPSYSTPYKGKN